MFSPEFFFFFFFFFFYFFFFFFFCCTLDLTNRSETKVLMFQVPNPLSHLA